MARAPREAPRRRCALRRDDEHRAEVHSRRARERTSAEKHVLWDGEVYAMAGASPAHHAIVANVLAELRAMTRRGPCQAFASDLKV